jgi:hypothetical protein
VVTTVRNLRDRFTFAGRLQETADDLKTKEAEIVIQIGQEREKIKGISILGSEVTVIGFKMICISSTCRYFGRSSKPIEYNSKPARRITEKL